jgi:hypothetical protein
MGCLGEARIPRILRPLAEIEHEKLLGELEESAATTLDRSRSQALIETAFTIRYDPPLKVIDETGANRPGAKLFYAAVTRPRTIYLKRGKRFATDR